MNLCTFKFENNNKQQIMVINSFCYFKSTRML